MRRTATIGLLVTPSLALAGCGGDDPTTVAAPATITETIAPQPAPTPAAAPVTSDAPTVAAPIVDFPMPNMVGVNLQVAQNTMQSHGVWYSVSHDLLGVRNQVMDGNWQVCEQNVPAGQQVLGDVEGQIDFGVVKLEESCP